MAVLKFLPHIKVKLLLASMTLSVGTILLGLGWIDGNNWTQIAIAALGIFSITHAATDMAAIYRTKSIKDDHHVT